LSWLDPIPLCPGDRRIYFDGNLATYNKELGGKNKRDTYDTCLCSTMNLSIVDQIKLRTIAAGYHGWEIIRVFFWEIGGQETAAVE
jgi:hypothetical protein